VRKRKRTKPGCGKIATEASAGSAGEWKGGRESQSGRESRGIFDGPSMGEGGREGDAKRDTAGYRESSEEAREQPVDFYFNSRRDLSFGKLRRSI